MTALDLTVSFSNVASDSQSPFLTVMAAVSFRKSSVNSPSGGRVSSMSLMGKRFPRVTS